MALDYLQPFAGDHAIQSAALALDFSSELEVSEVRRVRAAAAGLLGDFPVEHEQHRTTVQMSVGPMAGSTSTVQDLGGFILQKPSPLASNPQTPPLRQIVLSRGSVVIAVADYTRWARFKADTDRYLDTLLKPINAQKGIASIALQIVDAFIWRGDPDDLNLGEILNPQSALLTPNIFKQAATAWHSHHGYIVSQDQPVRHQLLENINLNRIIVDGAHQIQIVTSHKLTFERPIYKVLDASRQKVSDLIDKQHSRNKEILASLLSPELQEKIKLNGRGGA